MVKTTDLRRQRSNQKVVPYAVEVNKAALSVRREVSKNFTQVVVVPCLPICTLTIDVSLNKELGMVPVKLFVPIAEVEKGEGGCC